MRKQKRNQLKQQLNRPIVLRVCHLVFFVDRCDPRHLPTLGELSRPGHFLEQISQRVGLLFCSVLTETRTDLIRANQL